MASTKSEVARATDLIREAIEQLDGMGTDRQRWVLASIASALGIKGAELAPARKQRVDDESEGSEDADSDEPNGDDGERSALGKAKDFLRKKKPSSTVERIACLAYYLTHAKSAPEFMTKDLTKLNGEAHGERLSNPSMAADNASKAGVLAPAGKGKKRLTTHGEDIVDALPDRERVNEIHAERRQRRRRSPKGKKSSRRKAKAAKS